MSPKPQVDDRPLNDRLAVAFQDAILADLNDAVEKIRHCVDQLSEDQIWWRPTDSMNSIANLILHLCGNIRQWVISGVGGAPDQRNRPAEFSQRDRIAAHDLLKMLDQLLDDVRDTLSNITAEELLRIRSIQGMEVSGVQGIFDSTSHFRGHTQEIIHMTRLQLGESYKFDFVPRNDQQGGAFSDAGPSHSKD